MPAIIVTANHLHQGNVVWMNAALQWSTHRADAHHFDPENAPKAMAAGAASVQANEVISLYEIAVDGSTEHSARERVRAAGGPSITPPVDRRASPPKVTSQEKGEASYVSV